MNKKIIDIEKEIETLKGRYKNAPRAFLLININYDESTINIELGKNIEGIDKTFKTWEGCKIIETYNNFGIEKLIQDSGENLKSILKDVKADLTKKIKSLKKDLYLTYALNTTAYENIFKPALMYLLEKNAEIEKIIANIRKDIKKIN